MLYDALIIGAGPAGSACARLLAQAGWSVALVEKMPFPRRKVCGEFLSAPTLPVLEECGIAADYLAMAGPVVTHVGVYAGRALLQTPRAHAWGRALGREHLDVLLCDAAAAAGARLFQPAEVVGLRNDGPVQVATLSDGSALSARHVVAACGSWNAKGPFAIVSQDTPSDMFAFKAHFTNAALPPGLMPLLAFPGGYGGLVATDNGLLSLSCCIRRDALAAARQHHGGKAGEAVIAHIRATTLGVDRALAAAQMESLLATGPIHPGIRPRVTAGVYRTGNLAGEAHPVIAEGISMAIQGSHLLARCLIAHRGEDYAAAWQRRFAPRIRAASVFAHLAMRAPTRALCRPLLAGFPQLMEWGARLSGKA
jgi:flavin-dependent dehydrogenase